MWQQYRAVELLYRISWNCLIHCHHPTQFSLKSIRAIELMISLEMKCPQLSKPEATATRNQYSIGDRMEKKPTAKSDCVKDSSGSCGLVPMACRCPLSFLACRYFSIRPFSNSFCPSALFCIDRALLVCEICWKTFLCILNKGLETRCCEIHS